MKYGSIPAGGLGTRLQPLGFAKELVPVARRAVIEYLIERMLFAGIDKIFINTASDKIDLIRYLADKSPYKNNLIFMVRQRAGLFDGVAQPAQFLKDDDELFFGLPDTIWYPTDAFKHVATLQSSLGLGLFDTGTPEKFDSVTIDQNQNITSIAVKVNNPKTQYTWAIGKMTVKAAKLMRQWELDRGGKTRLFGDIMFDYVKKYEGKAVEFVGSKCLDIGIPEDYEKAEAFIKQNSI